MLQKFVFSDDDLFMCIMIDKDSPRLMMICTYWFELL